MKRLVFSLNILAMVLVSGTVFSAEPTDTKQKVDELYTNNARTLSAISELQQEVRGIRGQLDSNQYLMKESDRVYQDLDLRVSAMEDKVNQIHQMIQEMRGGAGGTEPLKKAPAKTSAEYEEFQKMLNLVNAQDFQGAASGFLGFIKKYPNSNYAGSAQFWAADSLYMMGDFVRAISEFQTLSEKYPQNPRVKEGVYKQGLSFMRLKKYTEARLFFQKVMATYPSSAEALQARARLNRLDQLEKGTVATAAAPTSSTPSTTTQPIMKPSPIPATPAPPSTPVSTPSSPTPPPPPPSSPPDSQVPLY